MPKGEIVKSISGALRSVVESPIAKELGKSVGSRIGVKENPVEAAQARAAQDQLQNPLAETWGFTCQKCKTSYKFLPLQPK